MDLENPGPLLDLLLKIDPSVFYSITRLLTFVVDFLDSMFLEPLFGASLAKGSQGERRAAAADGRTAQLSRVYFRGAFSIVQNHKPKNFFRVHEAYVRPEYVLEHDNITLHGITENEVFFCVSNPSKNVYEIGFAPFLFIVQFIEAQKMLVMSHEDLHKLGDQLGDPNHAKVTLLGMTARCGSTLVGQMLARIPKVRVMSEPWAFTHLNGLYCQGLLSSEAEYHRLLRSALRVQCKPEKDTEITHILLKMNNWATGQFPILKRFFPDVTQMFITRHLRPSLLSYVKVMQVLPRLFTTYTNMARKFFFDHAAFPYDDEFWCQMARSHRDLRKTEKETYEENLAFGYAGSIAVYLRNKSDFAKAIIFEDLKADPEKEAADILEIMGLDRAMASEAIKALGQDSQRGIFGKLGTASVKVTDHKWAKVDKKLEECRVPIRVGMSIHDLRKLVY